MIHRGWLGLFGSLLLSLFGCSAADSNDTGPSEKAGSPSSNGGTKSGAAGASSASAGRSQVSSAAGSLGTGKVDLAEKGLCQITIGCTKTIVDSPPITCTFDLKDSSGTTVYSDHAAVQLRGRSSMNFPKKNYGVELRDASDVDDPTSLLGMGKDEDWVLDGAWADRSFMRNRFCYGIFRDMSPERWAPQVRYCELTTNTKYVGIYALIEKIKRDDDRVVLPEDDGTGSTFLVKQDDDGTLKLSIGEGSKWSIIYPKSSLITQTQTQAVQAWLDKLGAALRSSAPADTLSLFDAATITDWILLEEFAKNVDGYNLSLYFARAAGGLSRVIPWDMDLAFGQPTVNNDPTSSSPTGWIASRSSLISKLSQNASLRQGLGPRWRELRTGVLSDQAVSSRIDDYLTVLTPDAVARNFAVWDITAVDFSQYYAPYTFYDVTSYDDEVAHLRSWIQQRLVWLDANIDSYPSK
jgi:hypothetical protein